MSTFSELLAEAYAECNLGTSPDAATVSRFKRYLNEGQRTVVGEPGMGRLLDSDVPAAFASEVDRARYALAESAAAIHGMRDVTNLITLRAMSLSQYREMDPDPTTDTGTPSHYVPIGIVAAQTQTSSTIGAGVWVKSTSAADTTQTAFVEATRLEGYAHTPVTATLTGLTAVQVGTQADYIDVTDFYLSAVAVGDVTLLDAAGAGTVLATIPKGRTRARFFGFYLWPTPSAITTYSADYRREVVEMVQDSDSPTLPTDFHYVLGAYARMRYYEKTSDERYPLAQAQYLKGLSRLKYQTQTTPDELPVVGNRLSQGHSRLGAWTPADYWTRG